MKIIFGDLNLVVIIFFILVMVRTLENNYFLLRVKLGYLRYIFVQWNCETLIDCETAQIRFLKVLVVNGF